MRRAPIALFCDVTNAGRGAAFVFRTLQLIGWAGCIMTVTDFGPVTGAEGAAANYSLPFEAVGRAFGKDAITKLSNIAWAGLNTTLLRGGLNSIFRTDSA